MSDNCVICERALDRDRIQLGGVMYDAVVSLRAVGRPPEGVQNGNAHLLCVMNQLQAQKKAG